MHKGECACVRELRVHFLFATTLKICIATLVRRRQVRRRQVPGQGEDEHRIPGANRQKMLASRPLGGQAGSADAPRAAPQRVADSTAPLRTSPLPRTAEAGGTGMAVGGGPG